ncbi:MAG: hypothetical protein V1816_21525 [Pseudomonadota bacterium]
MEREINSAEVFSRPLGRTGLKVARLGISSGYQAPAAAFEEAFERGINYFYWGWRRTPAMAEAIKNIAGSGRREKLVVAIQSFSRSALLLEVFLARALRQTGLDRADVLLLGWHNSPPPERLMEKALRLGEKGLVRFIGLSGHNRRPFPRLAGDGRFDVFHLRYNAAHRGAEKDVFPLLPGSDRPGLVSFTATRWGQLVNPRRIPPGQPVPTAVDCYRFVLSQPDVDVCLTGPKNLSQARQSFEALDKGPLSPEEMDWMRLVGDHVHRTAGRF